MKIGLSRAEATTASNKPKPALKKRTKSKDVAACEEETEDLAVVGSSLSVGVQGVNDLIRAVTVGTREFQELMCNELNLIYECRVCRNLFRSPANFISHKKKYCKNPYQYFHHGFYNDQIDSRTSVEQVSTVHVEPQMAGTASGSSYSSDNLSLTRPLAPLATVQRSPPPRMRGRLYGGANHLLNKDSDVTCRLESIKESQMAVYQTVVHPAAVTDSMKIELKELSVSLGEKVALVKEDGRALSDPAALKCPRCDSSFTTQRSLDRHVQVYHVPRKCYPCPICKIFLASPWGVFRHLYKLHGKSEEQIRRLRPQVLSKALTRELYEAVKPTAQVLPLKPALNEDQKWLADYVGDLHCGVCKKSFSRRAALTVHKCVKSLPKSSKNEQSKTDSIDSGNCSTNEVVEATRIEPSSTESSGPIKCTKCGREFGRRAALTVHIQSCTGRTENPPRTYKCSSCDRSFPRSRTLDMHKLRCSSLSKVQPSTILLMTPPKLFKMMTPVTPTNLSPSSIQVRREYLKPSPSVLKRCLCPLPCTIHPPIVPVGKLEKVVRKLQEQSPTDSIAIADNCTTQLANLDKSQDIPSSTESLKSVPQICPPPPLWAVRSPDALVYKSNLIRKSDPPPPPLRTFSPRLISLSPTCITTRSEPSTPNVVKDKAIVADARKEAPALKCISKFAECVISVDSKLHSSSSGESCPYIKLNNSPLLKATLEIGQSTNRSNNVESSSQTRKIDSLVATSSPIMLSVLSPKDTTVTTTSTVRSPIVNGDVPHQNGFSEDDFDLINISEPFLGFDTDEVNSSSVRLNKIVTNLERELHGMVEKSNTLVNGFSFKSSAFEHVQNRL